MLFHGEQRILPEELEELDTEESTVLKHREYAESITASRDNVKVRKKSSVLGGQSVEYSDHFVPRSYISNDELWNLTSMRKSLNSSKNNKLPAWDEFFALFDRYQFSLNLNED